MCISSLCASRRQICEILFTVPACKTGGRHPNSDYIWYLELALYCMRAVELRAACHGMVHSAYARTWPATKHVKIKS